MNSENTATHKITYSNIDIAKFIAAYYGNSGILRQIGRNFVMIKIMFVCHGMTHERFANRNILL